MLIQPGLPLSHSELSLWGGFTCVDRTLIKQFVFYIVADGRALTFVSVRVFSGFDQRL